MLLLFSTTFLVHSPLSTTNWEGFDYVVASFYCDRYTSSGNTQTSVVIPAQWSKKFADGILTNSILTTAAGPTTSPVATSAYCPTVYVYLPSSTPILVLVLVLVLVLKLKLILILILILKQKIQMNLVNFFLMQYNGCKKWNERSQSQSQFFVDYQ